MSDDDTDIAVGGGEPVAPPSETRAPMPDVSDEKSRTERVREQFNAGLNLMAYGTEDASDYARERKIQEKFLNGDEYPSGSEMAEWHHRTQTALQRAADAAARARGEIPPSQQQQAPQQIPGYIEADDPNYDAIIEANKQRFSDYFDNPERTGTSAS